MMRTDQRSRTRVRVVVVAVVIGTMLSAGALLVAIGSPERGGSPEIVAAVPPSTVTDGSAGPGAERFGMAAGFAPGRDGATVAAIRYATASQRWLYLTDQQIADAVRSITTPTKGQRLADQVVADVRAARDRLRVSSGRVWWLVRPLAWHVESFRADEATVSVWTVTVLSAETVAAPQSEWLTVTVDLVWLDGDWRVDGVRDAAGPTPMVGPNDGPWDAVPFDEALDGFTRIDAEPVS
jgi:hypothetical protein